MPIDPAIFFGEVIFADDTANGQMCFCGTKSYRGASFKGSVFKDIVCFRKTRFLRLRNYSAAVDFGGATFENDVVFDGATFCGPAFLNGATFSRKVWFNDVRFAHNASFELVEFQGFTSFEPLKRPVVFSKRANFRHIDASSALSLRRVRFCQIPDFVQAHFREPPDLDLIEIGREAPEVPAEELTARWRALKRMAAQTGHHYYTALFAAEETKARRPIDRHQRFGAWVVGWLYQWLSNFGLSMWRPLVWWAASLLLFAVVYNGTSPKLFFDVTNGRICQLFDGTAWITGKFGAALTYSLKKALVVGGLAKVEGLDDLGACLFGEPIPLGVVFTGIFQTAFSGLLILLFVLAIRNHMRAR